MVSHSTMGKNTPRRDLVKLRQLCLMEDTSWTVPDPPAPISLRCCIPGSPPVVSRLSSISVEGFTVTFSSRRAFISPLSAIYGAFHSPFVSFRNVAGNGDAWAHKHGMRLFTPFRVAMTHFTAPSSFHLIPLSSRFFLDFLASSSSTELYLWEGLGHASKPRTVGVLLSPKTIPPPGPPYL